MELPTSIEQKENTMAENSRNALEVADGKYTIVGIEDGKLHALRHGEPWRDLVGDKLVLSLAQELLEAREALREMNHVEP